MKTKLAASVKLMPPVLFCRRPDAAAAGFSEGVEELMAKI
jgi:hypothetical protein